MIREENPKLEINETIDGRPLDEALSASTPKKRRAKEGNALLPVDPWLWGIYIFLLIFSVIELFSASSTQVKVDDVYGPLWHHVLFLAVGFLIILGFQKLHYKWFRKYAWAAALISFVLLVYSFYFGQIINGAQRSIAIGGFSIQPAEIIKLTVMVVLAYILAKNQVAGGVSLRGIVLSSTVIAIFAFFTFRNGFTNTALLMIVSLAMMLIGGIQWTRFFLVLGIYVAIGGIAMTSKGGGEKESEFDSVGNTEVVAQTDQRVDRTELRHKRILDFFHGVSPSDKMTDENRQVMLSRFSMAHGGVIGRGPGNNRESTRLPLAFSDYIFSIIVEDTGLVGGVILLGLYLALLGRAGFVASKCTRAFPALLIMGCALLIVFQALIHMAIVTGLFPVSGQPLPFISSGGTSILVMSAAMGMMLSVSRFAARGNNKQHQRHEDKMLPEDIRTDNPSLIAG